MSKSTILTLAREEFPLAMVVSQTLLSVIIESQKTTNISTNGQVVVVLP